MSSLATVFSTGRDRALETLVRRIHPGCRLRTVRVFGDDDSAAEGETVKGAGYGRPLELMVERADGSVSKLVFHTATQNGFGHDFRSDRAAEMLLAYDTFNGIPGHVRAVDVGAVAGDGGSLLSLRDAGEFYLLTEYGPGRPYAEDLRRLSSGQGSSERDRARCDALVDWLVILLFPVSSLILG